MSLSRTSIALLLVLSASLASAQASRKTDRHASQPACNAPLTFDQGVLMKTDISFNLATQQRRLDGWMEFMADDVVARHGENVIGREALRKAMEADWSNPGYTLTWSPVCAHMVAGNKMGFTWGRWTLDAPKPDGSKVHLTGDYLTVWAEQKDGSWKVIWDGGGADPKGKPE